MRMHEAEVEVSDEAALDIFQWESNKDGQVTLDRPALSYMNEGGVLTATQARQLAAWLVKAADRLDTITALDAFAAVHA